MADSFLGEIKIGGWNFAPFGWAMCSGQLLPISQNTALFSLLGTQFGGNGTSNFALPDLQGRGAVGQGNSAVMGEVNGTETVTILSTQYPSHNHPFNVNATAAGLGQPINNFLASTTASPSTGQIYAVPGTLQPMNTTGNPPALGLSQGGNQPHANMQPFLAMTYVIAMSGIFPSRN